MLPDAVSCWVRFLRKSAIDRPVARSSPMKGTVTSPSILTVTRRLKSGSPKTEISRTSPLSRLYDADAGAIITINVSAKAATNDAGLENGQDINEDMAEDLASRLVG